MINKLSLALVTGSLLFGISSCKKATIFPNTSAPMEIDSTESQGEEKNNGTIYFTRCPNVKKQNLGANIVYMGQADAGVSSVQIFVVDFEGGAPTPLFDGLLLDQPTYSEDGLIQSFSTLDGEEMFPLGTSPLGYSYTLLSQALDANGGVIESMECTIEVTEEFQNGIKGKKTKVIENADGTAELQTIVNPRSYIDQNWVSTDQLTLSYDQLPANSLLIPGTSYTLEYAGMKDNGNLLFTKELSGPSEYSPSTSSIITDKRTITEENLEPSTIFIYRPSLQQTLACSSNGMKIIAKSFNNYINNVWAVQHNNGTISIKVKRSQKALIAPNSDISYAKITLINANDPTIQESFIRYEWDFDGDGINNYPQSNSDDLLAGLWDFDGDELNDYMPKVSYKISNIASENPVFLNDLGESNSAINVKVEFVLRNNSAVISPPSYAVMLQ